MIKKLMLLVYLCCSFTGIMPTIPDADKATLARMREEEKLSRDLYRTLNEQWHQMVFAHVSDAEVSHMQEIKILLDKYEVADPVARTGDVRGKFMHPPFQKLYDSLLTTGSASLEGALRAGAYVEEMDITDLQQARQATGVKDLEATYAYLVRASGQHLRAFTRNLRRVGVQYQPVILRPEEYERIVGMGGMGRMRAGRPD